MSCHVSCMIPPHPGTDAWESIGPTVQYSHSFERENSGILTALGIPHPCDNYFTHRGEAAEFTDTLAALDGAIAGLGLILDEQRDESSTTYHTWLYLREWRVLYDIVVKLRQRGIVAELSGA